MIEPTSSFVIAKIQETNYCQSHQHQFCGEEILC